MDKEKLPPSHEPVLRTTVLDILAPKAGDTVVDATLGLGGHAESFLRQISPSGKLYGLDADEENLTLATEKLSEFGTSFTPIHSNFKHIAELELPQADILFADLGVSSPHFDVPERGFSFRFDGPLDLRFDRSRGRTAAEMINGIPEEQLIHALKHYGEIRGAMKMAITLKKRHPQTTFDVKAIVEELTGYKAPSVLPQVFQALRILVNDELGALKTLLDASPTLLKPGGKIGIITFHSLEDRMVKQAFKALCETEKDPHTGMKIKEPSFVPLTKKGEVADKEETSRNPRSRSARFRAVQMSSTIH